MATYRRMLKDKDGNNIIPAGFVDAMYPIGSIYISATMSTVAQVQAAFGGTWVKWGAGRVPVGVDTSQTEFSTVGKTGGEKTHKLTIQEMPSHSHAIHSGYGANSAGVDAYRYEYWAASNLGWHESNDNVSLRATGGDQEHNNLQPYITCYMYKRTA